MHDACIFHDIVVIPFLYIYRYIEMGKKQRDCTFIPTSLFRDYSLIRGFLLSRIFVTIVSLLYNFYIIGEAVNFNALFNRFAVRLCFCGGMRI